MGRQLLIDGDILAFQVAANAETRFNWGDDDDGGRSVVSDTAGAIRRIDTTIGAWMEELKADSHVIALSDPSRRYFRHRVYPDYKKNRTHGVAPVDLPVVKENLRSRPEAKWKPELEADDVLGILQTLPVKRDETIIVTADKDLRQIRGLHWNPRKGGKVETVTQAEADFFFYQQTLSGDPTDGVPGLRGIGPARAKKILLKAESDRTSPWNAIVFQYISRLGLEDDIPKAESTALTNARLVRVLRSSDYSFTKKEPILWTPKRFSPLAS